jgi:hypothetical protein
VSRYQVYEFRLIGASRVPPEARYREASTVTSEVVIEHLRRLGFTRDDVWPDTMLRVLPGGVVVKAVWSPLHGTVLMGHHVGPRHAVQFEEAVPHDATDTQIRDALRRIAEQIGRCDPAWKAKHLRT